MRISGAYSLQETQYSKRPVARNKAEIDRQNSDSFMPSALAKDFNTARRAVSNLQDTESRTNLVNDIKNRLVNNEYNVSAEDVAGKILDQQA